MSVRIAGTAVGVVVGVVAAVLWWRPHPPAPRYVPVPVDRQSWIPQVGEPRIELPHRAPASIPAPGTPSTVAATGGPGVHGRLVDLDGVALANVVIRAGSYMTKTGASGEFVLALPAGRHRIVAQGRTIWHDIIVPDKGFTDLKLVAAERRGLIVVKPVP